MRLIIKHYLSILKERDELDALLPDLLLAAGVIPISRPQVGIRQYGVDIAAVGDDLEDGLKKLFLFTVKHGDFGRADWDTGQQAVRPSINEILDTYIPTHVSEQHKELPIKIVVVAGGDLRQDHQNTWANFSKTNSRENLQIVFWGGDQLAPMVEKYLLNEQALPVDCRKLLRKSIAFAGDPDYDLRDLYVLVSKLYEPITCSDATRVKKCSKQIRTATLCLLIFSRWSEDSENLKQPFEASENLLLKTWDFIRQHELFEKWRIAKDFVFCHSLFHKACSRLFDKIQPHCVVQDGLFVAGATEVEHPVRVFEFIGIVALIGLEQVFLSFATAEESEAQQSGENAQAICDTLMHLITNNPASCTPPFDSHVNEVGMALLLLLATENFGYVTSWLDSLLEQIAFTFRSNSGYPIATDSFEDLLALRMNRVERPERLKFCSTLLPILAEFCVIVDQLTDSQLYYKIVEMKQTVFKDLDFQVWHPDKETEEFLYSSNAGFRSGICFNSITLPESVDEFRQNLVNAMENSADTHEFSHAQRGIAILPYVSSRHFRTPLLPSCWRNFLLTNDQKIKLSGTDGNPTEELNAPEEPAKTS